MKLFLFDSSVNEVIVNEPEALLIREFATLWNPERNKCKEDPSGTKRKRAYRELTYIWLMCDWSSPYSDYTEQERNDEAKKDAKITEKEWSDPDFRAACRKYRELQDSSRVIKLIRSAQGVVDKISDYFNQLDIDERNRATGAPVYKAKDIMTELTNVSGIVEQLKTLEFMYKKEMEQSSDLMGDVTTGFMD